MSENRIPVTAVKKSIGTPSDEYDSMRDVWAKCRAVIRGQESVKAHDEEVNDYTENGSNRNILLPFSPRMTQTQYEFYRDEAELPGITSQYARSMVGALLRKDAALNLPDYLPDDVRDEITTWLRTRFTSDNRSLFHFLDDALWDEMQTSYEWIYVDVPDVDDEVFDGMTPDQQDSFKPYPVIIHAENVINVIMGPHPVTRTPTMTRFITRMFQPRYTEENPWHPDLVDTVRDHYLDAQGMLVIDEWILEKPTSEAIIENGRLKIGELEANQATSDQQRFVKVNTFLPQKFGRRVDRIPAWPLDGEHAIEEPILLNFVNREIGLYNKVSRRNHLMYSAATYTPVIIGDLDDEMMTRIQDSGLGSIWFLETGSQIDTLSPPTEALTDMQTAIQSTMDEMSKMGIRMLAPDTAESGVALELRNSAQTASLGTFNQKVSQTMRQVFAFMINWRYDGNITPDEIEFTMSSDFSPQAQGEAGMRLVSEWYQYGLVPRSIFIAMAKQNDFLPADYNDDEGAAEMEQDPVQQVALQNEATSAQIQNEAKVQE